MLFFELKKRISEVMAIKQIYVEYGIAFIGHEPRSRILIQLNQKTKIKLLMVAMKIIIESVLFVINVNGKKQSKTVIIAIDLKLIGL